MSATGYAESAAASRTSTLFGRVMGLVALTAAGLAKNSVGNKQLKNGAVTGSKVANGSLTGADLKPLGGWKSFPLGTCSDAGGGATWTAVAGQVAPGYRRDRDNVLHVRGELVCAQTPNQAVVGTLPAGARPKATEAFSTVSNDGGTAYPSYIAITTTGSLRLGGTTLGKGLSLDGISFDLSH